MLRFSRIITPLLILLILTEGHAQWRIVKRLSAEPRKTLNVDVPPSTEMRPPIVWSMSFPDDLNGWATCDDGTLLRTADGGNSWKRTTIYPRVNTSIPFFATNFIRVFFVNKRKGWIVAEHKKAQAVLGTENAGQSWKIKSKLDFKGSFHNVWFMDERRGWAAGEQEDKNIEGGVIYATQDGGTTWTLQYSARDNTSFFEEVKFVDSLNGWAVGENSVVHTADGGKSWVKQYLPELAFFFGLDVVTPKEAWVVGSSGIVLHTIDAGQTWTQVKLPTKYEDHWLNSVKFIDSNNGWVAGNDGVILFTNDAGTTWKVESEGNSSYLRGLARTEGRIFAFGNDGIVMQRSF
jgi:photosystem II stability/assembly factor-like uncharacterized protein